MQGAVTVAGSLDSPEKCCSSGTGRVPELDGLRAFAILPVLLTHFAPQRGALSWLGPVFHIGWIGVDLFFVLSGFLITGILLDTVGKPGYYRSFILRRALRIFPLYYACIAVFTAAVFFYPEKRGWAGLQSWGSPAWFLVYLGNVRMVMKSAFPPVFSFAPLWSLQVEEQFYLLHPLIIKLCRRDVLRRILIGCIIGAPLLRGVFLWIAPANEYFAYVLMPCRMDALAWGGLIALELRVRRSIRWPASMCFRLFLVFFAAFVVFCALVSGSPFASVMRVVGYSVLDLAFACLLAAVLTAGRGTTAILRWAPLVYTGQIAYGLYLLHGPAATVAREALSRFYPLRPFDTLSLPVSLAAAYAAAALSWHFFESPILRLKDRIPRAGANC